MVPIAIDYPIFTKGWKFEPCGKERAQDKAIEGLPLKLGRYGEQEDTAPRKGVLTIDWKEMSHLSGIKT